MYYGELITEAGIQQRGIFLSLEEFVPYRAAGWTSLRLDEAADARLAQIAENSENCCHSQKAVIQWSDGGRDYCCACTFRATGGAGAGRTVARKEAPCQ